MANASKKNMGSGSQGKKAGNGAMSETPYEKIGENMVLSNRDKAQHSRQRGLDSREIRNQQLQDHAGNHLPK
jgi:hypothetical protein